MSKLLNYQTMKSARKGDLGDLQKELAQKFQTKDLKAAHIWEALDTACNSESFRKDFSNNLVGLGVVTKEQAASLRPYSEEEKEKMMCQFAAVKLDGSLDEQHVAKYNSALEEARKEADMDKRVAVFAEKSGLKQTYATIDVGGFLETTVLPLLDGLVRNTPSISRISMITDLDYKKLIEFGAHIDAENLAKGAAGTAANKTTRTALTLDSTSDKIQASTSINARDLQNLDAVEWAYFIQDLVSRIQYGMEYNLYYATGASNTWSRGLKNSAGSDSTDMIGALTTDVSAGTNLIDKLKIMDNDLSKFLSASEEGMYTYSINRKLRGDLRLLKSELTGMYLLPETGDFTINGHSFISSPAIADNDVFLSPLAYYTAITNQNSINVVNDMGLVEIKEDNINYVARIYSDGSPRRAFKRTAGGSTDNNQDYNYHRYATVA